MPGAFSFVHLPPCFPARKAASQRTSHPRNNDGAQPNRRGPPLVENPAEASFTDVDVVDSELQHIALEHAAIDLAKIDVPLPHVNEQVVKVIVGSLDDILRSRNQSHFVAKSPELRFSDVVRRNIQDTLSVMALPTAEADGKPLSPVVDEILSRYLTRRSQWFFSSTHSCQRVST